MADARTLWQRYQQQITLVSSMLNQPTVQQRAGEAPRPLSPARKGELTQYLAQLRLDAAKLCPQKSLTKEVA